MSKKKTAKRNPQDATMRNVRAAIKRSQRLDKENRALFEEAVQNNLKVSALEERVYALEMSVRVLEEDAESRNSAGKRR